MCWGLCPIPQCSAEPVLNARPKKNVALFSSASVWKDCLTCVFTAIMCVREEVHLPTHLVVKTSCEEVADVRSAALFSSAVRNCPQHTHAHAVMAFIWTLIRSTAAVEGGMEKERERKRMSSNWCLNLTHCRLNAVIYLHDLVCTVEVIITEDISLLSKTLTLLILIWIPWFFFQWVRSFGSA